MNKKDVTLVVIILVAAIAFMIPGAFFKDSGKALIYVGGRLYGVYDLSSDTSIHLDNGHGTVNDIEISGGEAYMKDATCPGRQCVRSGHIRYSNQSIVCAPAGIMIIIRSGDDNEYDAVTD